MLIPFRMLFWDSIIINNAVVSGKLYALPIKLSMLADSVIVPRNLRPDTNMN